MSEGRASPHNAARAVDWLAAISELNPAMPSLLPPACLLLQASSILQFVSVEMGWMNRGSRPENRENNLSTTVNYYKKDSDTSPTVSFVEDSSDPRSYKKISKTTKNEDLPYIEPSVIIAARDAGLLWLVIDNIVYDCTEFVHDHPGGSRVLESFRSSNCSWQFWRFHGMKDMVEFGLPLRVGCTSGIQNKFKEPPRFVGLRKLWGSE